MSAAIHAYLNRTNLFLFFSFQLLFQKSKGTVQLAMELLDTEEENSDGPVDTEVDAWDLARDFSVLTY